MANIGIVPGLYAMVGAAATLSGVTVGVVFLLYACLFTMTAANDSLLGCHNV